MNKRGISHIEIMISFALFIGLLAIIFMFLQPVREPELSNVVLDIVEFGLTKDASITLGAIPFKINKDLDGADCFTLPHPLDTSKLLEKNLFVKDDNGLDRAFDLDGNTISIEKSDSSFYFIYFSSEEEFETQRLSGVDINPDTSSIVSSGNLPLCMVLDTLGSISNSDFTFSAPRTETLFSNKSLFNISLNYLTKYEYLKQRWFVPEKNDFSITITYSTDESLVYPMQKEIPQGKNVFAREITVNMIKGTDISQINVNIQIW